MRWFKTFFLGILLLVSFDCLAEGNLPEMQGWVNDFAGVISSEYLSKINPLIDELRTQTSTEIAIVTLQSIAPYTEEQYAQLLFDKWKIGKKGKDNGVLILLAVKERRWRIHTGYGVEGILPDALCARIGNNQMVSYFKAGDYSQGLYYGAAAVVNVIAKDAGISLNNYVETKSETFENSISSKDKFIIILSLFWILSGWSIFLSCPIVAIGVWFIFKDWPFAVFYVAACCTVLFFFKCFRWFNMSRSARRMQESFRHFLFYGYNNDLSEGYDSGGFGGGGFGGGGGGSSGGGGGGGGF